MYHWTSIIIHRKPFRIQCRAHQENFQVFPLKSKFLSFFKFLIEILGCMCDNDAKILTFGIICFNNVMMKSLSVERSWISSNITWEKLLNAGSVFINCNNIPVVQNNILPCSRPKTLRVKGNNSKIVLIFYKIIWKYKDFFLIIYFSSRIW